VSAFEGQLRYIRKHYVPVTIADVLAALEGEHSLPARAVLLTFDDGYVDHHQYVTPLLADYGFQGAFFLPAAAVEQQRMLDVNKIHFILAAADITVVVKLTEALIERARTTIDLPPLSELRSRFYGASRFDSAEIRYVKRLLQFALPSELRASIVDALFSSFVSEDEAAFAEQLYLSPPLVREMVAAGMHVGGHGITHDQFGHMGRETQAEEIAGSLRFLRTMGVESKNFTFCYPNGSFNADTVELLAEAGCRAAFTTAVGLADFPGAAPLEIPRIATNDLPTEGDASIAAWTCAAANLAYAVSFFAPSIAEWSSAAADVAYAVSFLSLVA
jgi:peptidoglycan/xylan/chitin deacetylase (PgdA/CDA1 family)